MEVLDWLVWMMILFQHQMTIINGSYHIIINEVGRIYVC